MKQVEFIGIHAAQGSGLPVVLLREADEPRRLLQVFVGPTEANAINLAISGRTPPRPMTHDLITDLLSHLGSQVDAVEVTELAQGTFHAALVLATPHGPQRIDTRPSDGIALAVRAGAAIFAADQVLDEAGAFVADDGTVTDPRSIDVEVGQFRAMLDDLDIADLTPETTDPDEQDTQG